MSFEWFIALRYLRSKRKEVFISIITVISVLSVAISVAVLDMVLAIMTGFEAELRDKLLGTSEHIVVRSYQGTVENWRELEPEILAVPGVLSVYPYTLNQAMISTPLGAQGLLVRGVANHPEPRAKIDSWLTGNLTTDALWYEQTIDVVRPDGSVDQVTLPPLVIGKSLEQKLHVVPGEPVNIIAPELLSSPQGLIPKLRRFVFIGSYQSGLVEFENGLAYTSLEAAQRFFGFGASVTGIEVKVRDLFEAQAIAQEIVRRFGSESPYYATDWTEPNRPLWEAMKLEKRVYFYVLLLLILVASFSIVSTLVMVVMEKGKDIAILKTIGSTDGSVMKIFLIQGSIIGTVGTLVGTLLGVVGCIAIREWGISIDPRVFSLDRVPVHMVPLNFLLVGASGFVITALSGIYPAWRGSRLEPAEAFRYE